MSEDQLQEPQENQLPTVQTAPPKKKRTWLVVLVVVVLLGCIAASAVGGILYLRAQTQNEVEAALMNADVHMSKAMEIAGDTEALYDGLEAMSSGSIQGGIDSMVSGAQANLALAEEEIVAAEYEISALDDSETKSAYQESISETRLALKSTGDVFATFGEAGGILQAAIDASTAMGEVNIAMNDAINKSNNKNYSEAKTIATKAVKMAEEAEKTFSAAHAEYPDAEFDKAADIAKLKRQQAETVLKLAEYGKAGSTSKYNKAINDFNGYNTKVLTAVQPRIFTDPTWLLSSMQDFLSTIAAHTEKAQDASDRAHDAFDAGNY